MVNTKRIEDEKKSEMLRQNWKDVDQLQRQVHRKSLLESSQQILSETNKSIQNNSQSEEYGETQEKIQNISPSEKQDSTVVKPHEDNSPVQQDLSGNSDDRIAEISKQQIDPYLLAAKEVMEDILNTLEIMEKRKKTESSVPTPQSTPPLRSARTRESVRTDATDYTMVTDDDDPIDVEKLKKEMRSAYLKEWADLRGLVFDNEEEAEKAFQESKIKKGEESEPKPPTPITEEPKPMTPPQEPKPSTPPQVTEEPKVDIPVLDLNKEEPSTEAHDIITPLQSSRKPSRSNRSRSSNTSRKSSRRRKSSLFHASPGQGDQQQDSDGEDNETKKDKFRENFPQMELDALLGFFPELRLQISDLLRQKRHLKLDISEWKAEYFIQHGREATWEERKAGIGDLYEKYHEVGYKANKALQELTEAENDLLRTWEVRRLQRYNKKKGNKEVEERKEVREMKE